MDIVRPLVSSEDYVVQKYTKAHPFKAMGRVQASASAKTLRNSQEQHGTARPCSVKYLVAIEFFFTFLTSSDELSPVACLPLFETAV